MKFLITTFGTTALASGPLTLTSVSFGDLYAYLPTSDQTSVTGNQVFSVPLGDPVSTTGNTDRYTIYLNDTIGPFGVGEFVLYSGEDAVAVAVRDFPLQKRSVGSGEGNSFKIDLYVINRLDGSAEIFADIETSDDGRLESVSTFNDLPSPVNTTSNVFFVQSPEVSIVVNGDSPLWNYGGYSEVLSGSVTEGGEWGIQFDGVFSKPPSEDSSSVLIQFVSGVNLGVTRTVQNAYNGSIFFHKRLESLCEVGDSFRVYERKKSAESIEVPTKTSDLQNDSGFLTDVPVASAESIGGVRIGSNLLLDDTGTLNGPEVPVQSVNGKTGAVHLVASDLGISTVGTSGDYRDLANTPQIPTKISHLEDDSRFITDIPVASAEQSGTVKIGSGLSMSANGVLSVNTVDIPVVSVNGMRGAILLDSTNLPGLSRVSQTGDYNDLINKPDPTVTPLARRDAPGIVQIGSGLSVDKGVISSLVVSVAGKTGAVTLNVNDIGGLKSVAKTGSYLDLVDCPPQYSLPQAGENMLGGVKIGSGVYLDQRGRLSAQVLSVNGKTGTINLSAADLGLSQVSQTGDYNDLINKPAVPQHFRDLQGTLDLRTNAGNLVQVSKDGTKLEGFNFALNSVRRFGDLRDVPSSFRDANSKTVVVNKDGTALEFRDEAYDVALTQAGDLKSINYLFVRKVMIDPNNIRCAVKTVLMVNLPVVVLKNGEVLGNIFFQSGQQRGTFMPTASKTQFLFSPGDILTIRNGSDTISVVRDLAITLLGSRIA